MPEPMTAERLRLVFDLFAKTKASVRGVARVVGISEDEAREVLCGDSYGRERSIYGVRRMGHAAEVRGMALNPHFAPPRYYPASPRFLQRPVFPDFREHLKKRPSEEHLRTLLLYSSL